MAAIQFPPLRPDPRAPAPSSRVEPRLETGEIVAAAIAVGTAPPSADGFASHLGLRNRHQLNRELRRRRLPSYRVLAAVGRLVRVHGAARDANRSLCSEMNAEGLDPAWAYRTVRRLTGRSWSELRHLSPHDLMLVLLGAGASGAFR